MDLSQLVPQGCRRSKYDNKVRDDLGAVEVFGQLEGDVEARISISDGLWDLYAARNCELQSIAENTDRIACSLECICDYLNSKED